MAKSEVVRNPLFTLTSTFVDIAEIDARASRKLTRTQFNEFELLLPKIYEHFKAHHGFEVRLKTTKTPVHEQLKVFVNKKFSRKEPVVLTDPETGESFQSYTRVLELERLASVDAAGYYLFQALKLYHPLINYINKPTDKAVNNLKAYINSAVNFGRYAFLAKQLLGMPGVYARTGKKVKDSQQRGHEATHGTAKVKAQKRRETLEECLRIAKEEPRLKLTSIREEAARKLKCSLKTVQRHVPNLAQEVQKIRSQKT